MDKLIELIERIFKYLTNRGFEVDCEVKQRAFSNDQLLNLKSLGKNKGVRYLTIQNEGKTYIYVGDAKQLVRSGGSYTIAAPNRIVNEQFQIVFGGVDASADASLPTKQAYINYLVDKC